MTVGPMALTAAEVAEPLVRICMAVPAGGQPRVCRLCHGPARDHFALCLSCARVRAQVSAPCPLVAPVSLCQLGSPLYRKLWAYKSGHVTSSERHHAGIEVVSLLVHFLACHATCISDRAGGGWDLVTCVPSSRGRDGAHPLAQALAAAPEAPSGFAEVLQACRSFHRVADAALGTRGRVGAPGVQRTGHNRACDDGFEVVRSVTGRRVLVVDDTFTSGARAQSASSALVLAGAQVVAVVPVARVVRPEFSRNAEWLASRLADGPFRFDRCCLET
ncbi:MAG: hypothetical protein ACYCS7_08450 [Acidimicrobiales bacterium]